MSRGRHPILCAQRLAPEWTGLEPSRDLWPAHLAHEVAVGEGEHRAVTEEPAVLITRRRYCCEALTGEELEGRSDGLSQLGGSFLHVYEVT